VQRTESARGQQDCAGFGSGSGELIVTGGEGQAAAKSEFKIGCFVDGDLMDAG